MGEVIEIFSKRKRNEEKEQEKKGREPIKIEALERSYKANQERIKEERKKANKSVIRSYRLKK